MTLTVWVCIYLSLGAMTGLASILYARSEGMVGREESYDELMFGIAAGLVWPVVYVFFAVVTVVLWVRDKRAEKTSD